MRAKLLFVLFAAAFVAAKCSSPAAPSNTAVIADPSAFNQKDMPAQIPADHPPLTAIPSDWMTLKDDKGADTPMSFRLVSMQFTPGDPIRPGQIVYPGGAGSNCKNRDCFEFKAELCQKLAPDNMFGYFGLSQTKDERGSGPGGSGSMNGSTPSSRGEFNGTAWCKIADWTTGGPNVGQGSYTPFTEGLWEYFVGTAFYLDKDGTTKSGVASIHVHLDARRK